MAKIHMILQGKGGVGKSTIAANLAVALAQSGATVSPDCASLEFT